MLRSLVMAREQKVLSKVEEVIDAFAVEVVRSDDEGEEPFDDDVVESDEDSDSSIDLRTPLSSVLILLYLARLRREVAC